MPENSADKKINWKNVLIGAVVGAILIGLGVLIFLLLQPKPEQPAILPTPKTTTTSAIKKEEVTLPVIQLQTTFGVEGENTSEPPKSVVVNIPYGYSNKLAAYFAADLVIVAPVNWTGQGLMAANGSKGLDLHPISKEEKGKISVHIGSPGTGSCLWSAAPYFPWVQEHWHELYGDVEVPASPTGINRTFISNTLIKYTLPNSKDGLEVNGVAYSDFEIVKDDFGAFENIEVTLPLTQHHLAIAILDAFISIRGLK
jgi:hypothetical protein